MSNAKDNIPKRDAANACIDSCLFIGAGCILFLVSLGRPATQLDLIAHQFGIVLIVCGCTVYAISVCKNLCFPKHEFRFRVRSIVLCMLLFGVIVVPYVVTTATYRIKRTQALQWVHSVGGTASGRSYSSSVNVCLDDTDVTDVSPLLSLPGLLVLDLIGSKVNDVSPLRLARSLRAIYLGGPHLRSIETIEVLDQVEDVYLFDADIDDFSPLHSMKHLKLIILYDVDISDEQLQALEDALPNCEISP